MENEEKNPCEDCSQNDTSCPGGMWCTKFLLWLIKPITVQVPDDFKVPEGYEIKIVKKEEKKKPVIKTYQDLIDNEAKIRGAYIGLDSKIFSIYDTASKNNINIAASEKVTKSMLAMAMISQLMPYYGGEITNEEWKNSNLLKYVIYSNYRMLSTSNSYTNYYYLAFHTKEQRNEFLKYNEQLVREYLMID